MTDPTFASRSLSQRYLSQWYYYSNLDMNVFYVWSIIGWITINKIKPISIQKRWQECSFKLNLFSNKSKIILSTSMGHLKVTIICMTVLKYCDEQLHGDFYWFQNYYRDWNDELVFVGWNPIISFWDSLIVVHCIKYLKICLGLCIV